MSALFDFKAFLTVVLLTICTCTYIKGKFPSLLNDRTGFRGLFWKAARIGGCKRGACSWLVDMQWLAAIPKWTHAITCPACR